MTPKEFNTEHKEAIELYSYAVWQLADLLAVGKKEFGRKQLLELTRLPSNKIDWFISIANLTHRDINTLPESHYEVVGLSPKVAKQWLDRSSKEGLKPTELRKLIRDTNKQYKKPIKQIEVSQWAKNLMLADNELKRTKISNPQVIVDKLKPLVELYNKLNGCGVNAEAVEAVKPKKKNKRFKQFIQ